MSVKGKVKRLNKKIEEMQDELQIYKLSNSRLRDKVDMLKIGLEEKMNKQYTETLENIVKFAITNHIGSLRGGITIERCGIEKMRDLSLRIEYLPEINCYIIKVSY